MQITILMILSFSFLIHGTASDACRDRLRTRACKNLLRNYRLKGIEGCKWKSVKSICALTCNSCVVKPKCALETSKYGCCWDKKTEAKGFYGEGCPECTDRYPKYCQRRMSILSTKRACDERGKAFCPKSCGVCRLHALAQPIQDCFSSPHGCCWDYSEAEGPNGEGCMECRDQYPNVCTLWYDFCDPDALKYKVLRQSVEFIKANCPVTCKKCQPGQRLLKSSRNLDEQL
ncbi:uncharacterized protein [Pocillopora verrucosa]|uniref:uncharacterized protein n=1 Tax=Pocillopora verrucosa TaxID=203993 RepID=UPI003341DDA9